MRFFALSSIAFLMLSSCGGGTQDGEDFGLRSVTMPDGRTVRADSAITQEELIKGLMFRPSLASDHGMLFIHNKLSKYPKFMYNMQIPLDMIWMDSQKTVVEIEANAPLCQAPKASQCPLYGGKQDSQFLLQLAAGQAAKYQVTVGSKIDF
jgi:uncharacterized protein